MALSCHGMMGPMKAILMALGIAMLASTALACTAEEMQSKAIELPTKLMKLAATDPQKAAENGKKLTEAQSQSQSVVDLDGACKHYDEILAEFE